jgi:transcriptional regulator with XRE-family HTH domain
MSAAVYVSEIMGAREFGEWLRQRMDDLPITQAELSRRSGVNEGSLSRYRAGRNRPDPDTIVKLAAPLQADPDVMLQIAGHRPSSEDDGAERQLIIRTEKPSVYRIATLADGQDDEDVERAIRILEAMWRDDK